MTRVMGRMILQNRKPLRPALVWLIAALALSACVPSTTYCQGGKTICGGPYLIEWW